MTELSEDQINSGFDKMLKWESPFPPTVLQFRQLCLPVSISPDGKNSDAYLSFDDPKHPEYEFYSKPKQLEDKTMVSKRKQKGIDALDELKDMF